MTIAIGSAVLLGMAVFIIIFVTYYQQKQAKQQIALKEIQERHRLELMAATFSGQEAERQRLAEDLHDSIGTMLSVTKMSLNQLGRQLADEQNRQGQLRKTRTMLDETLSNVRRISRDLVPLTLQRFGLLAALDELADRATNDELRVVLDCPASVDHLPSALQLVFYRITQELLNNAIRHARATTITIQLYCVDHQARLSMIDDGIGFDFDSIMADKKAGLGLRNIESRLNVVAGHVTFDVAPGRGSRIHAQVSLDTPLPMTLIS